MNVRLNVYKRSNDARILSFKIIILKKCAVSAVFCQPDPVRVHVAPVHVYKCHISSFFLGLRTCRLHHDVYRNRIHSLLRGLVSMLALGAISGSISIRPQHTVLRTLWRIYCLKVLFKTICTGQRTPPRQAVEWILCCIDLNVNWWCLTYC